MNTLFGENLFAKHFDAMEQRQAQQRSTQLVLATPEPEATTEALNLGNELGIPPQAVQGAPETFRTQAQQLRSTTALRGAPLISDWLGDTINGSIAKDDLENLTWWEKSLPAIGDFALRQVGEDEDDKFRNEGILSLAGRRGQELAAGLTNMLAGIPEGAAILGALNDRFDRSSADYTDALAVTTEAEGQMLTARIAEIESTLNPTERPAREDRLNSNQKDVLEAEFVRLIQRQNQLGLMAGSGGVDAMREDASAQRAAGLGPDGEVVPAADRPIFAYGDVVREASASLVGVAPEDNSLGSLLSEGAGSLIGIIAATLVGGVPAGMGVGVSAGASGQYEEAISFGASEEDALRSAGLGGLIGATEIIPIGRALDILPSGIKSRLSGIIGARLASVFSSGGEEAVQEALATIASNMVAAGVYDPERGILDGAGTAALVGAILGGGLGGTVGTSQPNVRLMSDIVAAATAGNTAGVIDQIDEMAGASQVRERSPERFQQALEAAGVDGQPLYVPAEGLQEYFQAKDITLDDETLRAWGIEPDDYAEKLASGGDITVPVSTYATRIQGTEDAAWFRDNATFTADEMSVSEAADFNASVAETMEQAFAEAETARLSEAETRADDVQIYDQVFSDLRAAGRSPDVAKNEATVWSSFWRTMGERYGETALSLAQSMGVQIRGPQTPEVARRRDQTDRMLNTLRSRGEKALRPTGMGILDFVRDMGGVRDLGGDVESMDAPKGIVSETRAQGIERQSQPDLSGSTDFTGRGVGLDEIGRAMIEAGYFPEFAGGADIQADGTVVDEAAIALDAISEAIGGRERYIEGEGPDADLTAFSEQLSEQGIDISMSNDDIMAALKDGQPGGQSGQDGQTYDQNGQLITDTPEFRAWAGTDEVLDPDEVNFQDFTGPGPWVMRSFHGTTHQFEEFDASIKGTKEGQFGAVNYFTTSEADASGNYGANGPDLTNRIENMQERAEGNLESALEGLTDEDAIIEAAEDWVAENYPDFDTGSLDQPTSEDMDEAVDGNVLPVAQYYARQISSLLNGGEETVLEVFVRTEKPFVVGGDNSPFMEFVDFKGLEGRAIDQVADNEGITAQEVMDARDDYEDQIDEARWDLESETENPLISAVQDVAARYDLDASDLMADLSEIASEGADHSTLEKIMRGSKGLMYAEDPETGDTIGYQVLAEIIEALGFDSIILKNADQRFENMDIDPDTAHVHVFDSHNTNIKSVDNQGTFDANDPRILFQQDGPEQPLAVAHNISARGLQIADGLGGLAAPSLGVVRADIGPLDGFGEITLIAGPELADPKQSGVRAFNADVYSVRQPRALTAITKKDKATIEKRLDPAAEELGGRFYDLDTNDFERGGLTYLADQPEVKLAYLRDQGISFRVPMTKLPEVPKDLRRIVSGQIFEVRKDPKMMAAITDHFGRLADELIERLPEKFSDRPSTPYFEADGTPETNQFNRLVNNIATSKGARKPDYFAARSALAKKIEATNTRQSDFLGWVEDQFSGNTGGLFFEKPNGRRVPYDLDELVRFMRGKVRDAEGFNFGIGNIRSNMAREFTSISQVKGARSDIVTKAEFEVVKKEVGAEFEALMDRLKPHLHGSDGYGHFNRASEFLGDMAKGNMREWAGDNMVAPLTPELTTDIRSFLSKLKVLPTEYFEVKMQRAVNLSEFSTALVPKSASPETVKLLKSHGIQVRRYDGSGDTGRAEAMAALNPKTFFQREDKGPRGSIILPRGGLTEGETVINLFESANLSTFLHESGHFFLEAFTQMATSPNAPQAMRDDLNVIHKFLGVEDGFSLVRDQHETWARGFEAYLMEGKAPSLELASSFARFKTWLSRIYKSIAGLNVKLTPEIREVMDRMLATDSEIAAMRSDLGMKPLFTDAAPVGMSDADFATYQRMARRSVEQAEASLMNRTMEKVRRETQAWFKEEKESVRVEVEASANRMPVYRLTELATNQKMLGDTDEAVPDIQIDRDQLVEQFGEGVIAELSRARIGGRRAIYTKGGESPGMVAEMFGFSTALDMVEALQNAGKRKEFIATEVDRVMTSRHGDPLNDGSIEEAAALAVHSDQQSAMVTAEARAIAKRLGRPTRDIKAKVYVARARDMLGRMSVREASRPASFLQAERRAAKTAEQAFARVARGGKNVEPALAAAMQAKEQQILNGFLYREARDFETLLNRGRDRMQSYSKATVRAKVGLSSVDPVTGDIVAGHIEQIDALLDRFDFRSRSKKQIENNEALRSYIDRMIADGRGDELSIDQKFVDGSLRTHYSRLSVNDLNGLFDTIANIDHMGRRRAVLVDRARRRDLNEVASRVSMLVRERFGSDKLDKQSGQAKNFFNLLLRVDTISADIDKSEMGDFYDAIKRPLDEGASLEQRMNSESAVRVDEIFSAYSSKEKATFNKPVSVLGANGHPWTKQQILSVALNTGNASNRVRVLDRRVEKSVRLTEPQLDALLGTMEKKDWDFVQSVWDYVDGFKKQSFDTAERMTGVRPKSQDAQAFTNVHGSYRGGYYPVSYDPSKSQAAARDVDSTLDDMMSTGRGSAAKVADGFTKDRAANGGGRALNYDFSVMMKHTRDTTRLIAMGEPVQNARRILGHAGVNAAFREGGVSNLLSTLDLFLQDIASGPLYNNDAINSVSRIIKNNFTMSRLSFNFKTVALQVTGLGQSAAVIGKMNMVKGLAEYTRRPIDIKNEVMAKSPFMAERQTTFQKDVYDMADEMRQASPIANKRRQTQELVSKAGFFAMVKTQFHVVDMPTWLGAYQAEIKRNGNDEAKAIHFADRMVDRSQGGGFMTDRNSLERGTLSKNVRQADFVRLWTTLGGYMVTKMNRIYLAKQFGLRDMSEAEYAYQKVLAAANMASDLALLMVWESVSMGLIYAGLEALGDGFDDDEADELRNFLMKETVGSVLGGVPFVRESVGAFNGYGAGGVLSSALEIPANIMIQASQGDNDKQFRRAIADSVGIMTGMPTTQTMRIIEELLEGDKGSIVEATIGRNPLTY
jgi:hypothetical protein